MTRVLPPMLLGVLFRSLQGRLLPILPSFRNFKSPLLGSILRRVSRSPVSRDSPAGKAVLVTKEATAKLVDHHGLRQEMLHTEVQNARVAQWFSEVPTVKGLKEF